MSQGRRGIDAAFDRARALMSFARDEIDHHWANCVFIEKTDDPTKAVVKDIRPAPDHIGFLVQDAVHYTRCGLDYLAWRLVEVNNGEPKSSTSFPIGTREADYATWASKRLGGASPDHIGLVIALNAHVGGDRHFVDLADVDNNFKHRLMPVTAATSGTTRMKYFTGPTRGDAVAHPIDIQPREWRELQVGDMVEFPRVINEVGGEDGYPYIRTEIEPNFGPGLHLALPNRMISVKRVNDAVHNVIDAVQSLVSLVA